jgi:hypothetical protein
MKIFLVNQVIDILTFTAFRVYPGDILWIEEESSNHIYHDISSFVKMIEYSSHSMKEGDVSERLKINIKNKASKMRFRDRYFEFHSLVNEVNDFIIDITVQYNREEKINTLWT